METKAREYYLECSNVNNPDTFVGDVYLTMRSDTSIHVIECSAYEKLQKRVEELEASQIHTCHDDCQRLECAQRRKIEGLEAENKKMREALCYIKEYWNGTYTGDFASYTIDACSEELGDVGE